MLLKAFFRRFGYLFFMALGAVFAIVLLMVRRNRYGLNKRQVSLFAVFLIASGVLGGKLMFFILSGGESMAGISFGGALLLIAAVMPMIGRILGIKPIDTGSFCAPCAAAVITVVPFGCVCSGCCAGKVFPQLGFRWPAPLVESFVYLLLLLTLIRMEIKHVKINLYAVFLAGYSILRFFAEFLRDAQVVAIGLTQNQLLYIITGLIGAAMLISHYFPRGKKHAN